MRPLLAVFVLLAACDPDSEAACAAAAEEEGLLEIGTGAEGFEPVADGDHLQIQSGGQGGHHVYGSLRASGVVQGIFEGETDPVVTFEVLDGEGTVLAGYEAYPRHFVQEDEALVHFGDTLILEANPGSLDGVEVTLVAELEDACGRVLTDERVVTLDY